VRDVDVGVSAGLELVDGFCCLGGMLGVNGGAGAAVETGVWVGWNELGQLVPLLAGGDMSLVVRRTLCSSCVQGGVLRGGRVAFQQAGMGWLDGCVA